MTTKSNIALAELTEKGARLPAPMLSLDLQNGSLRSGHSSPAIPCRERKPRSVQTEYTGLWRAFVA